MPVHRETKVFPYAPEQVFNLIADVERYPEFLPWCVACRIARRESPTVFTADLAVGFKMVREKFTSRVVVEPTDVITVEYINGPFEHLTNEWKFSKVPEGTKVEFFLTFEFRSKILQKLIGVLFEEAVHRMVAAFEARAVKLYGGEGFRSNCPSSG
jgi:coenzyme Q-binding protein COQ10